MQVATYATPKQPAKYAPLKSTAYWQHRLPVGFPLVVYSGLWPPPLMHILKGDATVVVSKCVYVPPPQKGYIRYVVAHMPVVHPHCAAVSLLQAACQPHQLP